MRSPSGGGARRRGGTQVGKAPPWPEIVISGLTRGQVFGEDQIAKSNDLPRLCRTLRPAPQAGCFVSRLSASKDSAQITLRHRAFRTVAVPPSRDCWSLFSQTSDGLSVQSPSSRRLSRASGAP